MKSLFNDIQTFHPVYAKKEITASSLAPTSLHQPEKLKKNTHYLPLSLSTKTNTRGVGTLIQPSTRAHARVYIYIYIRIYETKGRLKTNWLVVPLSLDATRTHARETGRFDQPSKFCGRFERRPRFIGSFSRVRDFFLSLSLSLSRVACVHVLRVCVFKSPVGRAAGRFSLARGDIKFETRRR